MSEQIDINTKCDEQLNYCKSCKINKSIKFFNKHPTTKNKLDQRCRDCQKEQKYIYNLKKKETGNSIKETRIDDFETDLTSCDWQGGKISGSVFTRGNSAIASVGGKQISFNINQYGSPESAILAAKTYQLNKSDELNLTKNKYKIIFTDDNKPKYIIVQLSQNYVTLCDLNQLEFIKKHNLCVTKGGNINSKHYVGYSSSTIPITPLHNYIINQKYIDHINRYPMDNRSCNLRVSTCAENNVNKTVNVATFEDEEITLNDNTKIIRKMPIGVRFSNRRDVKTNNIKEYGYKIRLKVDGKEKSGYFNITKFGERKAYRLAVKYRRYLSYKYQNFNNRIGEKSYNLTNDKIKSEFENIMNQHAIGFKWNDNNTNITNENNITHDNNECILTNKRKFIDDIDEFKTYMTHNDFNELQDFMIKDKKLKQFMESENIEELM